MSRFKPESFAEALSYRQAEPPKPRKPMARRSAEPKKKKRVKTSTLKNKVWMQFSTFIRTRGADSAGFNLCVTCERKLFWRDLQAGHFIRGRLNANLFTEIGTHPQCYSCNVGAQGAVVIYYKFMLAKYGQEVIDELIQQNSKTHKWQGGELQDLLDRYTALNAANPIVALGLQPTDSTP